MFFASYLAQNVCTFKEILNFKRETVNVPVEPIIAGVNIVAVPSLHMIVHLSGAGAIRYKKHASLPPATKLGQGYVFTRVSDSVHRGVLSQHALQQVSKGGLFSGRCLLLGGSALGGVPGGDPPGRLLLWAVRILLECFLVTC